MAAVAFDVVRAPRSKPVNPVSWVPGAAAIVVFAVALGFLATLVTVGLTLATIGLFLKAYELSYRRRSKRERATGAVLSAEGRWRRTIGRVWVEPTGIVFRDKEGALVDEVHVAALDRVELSPLRLGPFTQMRLFPHGADMIPTTISAPVVDLERALEELNTGPVPT